MTVTVNPPEAAPSPNTPKFGRRIVGIGQAVSGGASSPATPPTGTTSR
jgi:hypothetical protein